LLADNTTQALANIQFQRGNEYFPASVTLPAPFSILSPSGPVNLNRSAGKLRVQLSRDVSNGVYISLSLQCRRTDGSSFTDITDFNPRLDNDAYRIDTANWICYSTNAAAQKQSEAGDCRSQTVTSIWTGQTMCAAMSATH
jgi:hypothetical protein